MPNIECFTSGDSSAPVSLSTGGTLYYVARIDGVSNKVHFLKSLDVWIENLASTEYFEVVIARCATSNVDTEWAAITGQKSDSSAGAAVAGQVYKPSGGTPAPTSVTRVRNYGGQIFPAKFYRLFNEPINPSETLLIGVQASANSKNARWNLELQTP